MSKITYEEKLRKFFITEFGNVDGTQLQLQIKDTMLVCSELFAWWATIDPQVDENKAKSEENKKKLAGSLVRTVQRFSLNHLMKEQT